MTNLYWVGIRSSEISHVDIFKGSVTIVGDGRIGNSTFQCDSGARINYNDPVYTDTIDSFFKSTLTSIANNDQDALFMLYNPSNVYKYGDELIGKTVCLNPLGLLNALHDKVYTRFWLSNYCPVLPSTILPGKDCIYTNLRKIFPTYKAFVIQENNASGGFGTFVVSKDSSSNNLPDYKMFLVSPFYGPSTPINVHIIVYRNKVVVLPPSIQLIVQSHDNRLLYKGADFISYKQISQTIRNNVIKVSEHLGEQLRRFGYYGVAGLDFVIFSGKVYLAEINPRFQASTALLNRALSANSFPSIQELVLSAFVGDTPTEDFNINVPFSNYNYNEGGTGSSCLTLFEKNKELVIDYDGYQAGQIIHSGAYLYRVNFPNNVSSPFTDGSVFINDNILDLDIDLPQYLPLSFNNKKQIKIELLNQGIRLSESVEKKINKNGDFRAGVFNSIDIDIFNGWKVNCPYDLKFTQYSPYEIVLEKGEMILKWHGKHISPVKIDSFDPLSTHKTSIGTNFSQIAWLATDRVRISHSSMCMFKYAGRGCAFCNLPHKSPPHGLIEIYEVIDQYLKNSTFRHFLIGGGSAQDESNKIIAISQHIRSACNKPIYAMCLPNKDKNVLLEMKNSGVTEIAFNIEIYDDNLAKKLMPGKGAIPRDEYFIALTEAVKIWGAEGNVKSIIVAGIEDRKKTLECVERLCTIGVEPILSAFRPLPLTKMYDMIQPSSKFLMSLHDESQEICNRYGQRLGPGCVDCQNNTISVPF